MKLPVFWGNSSNGIFEKTENTNNKYHFYSD
jgi:hypothetical protein